jgi:hypothetical protein
MCFCFVNIISSFQNSILIGWFPSKSIKVWRKIGWSSIPSKLVKGGKGKISSQKTQCHCKSFCRRYGFPKFGNLSLYQWSHFLKEHLECRFLTNYENIAVTLCLMNIAILRRRLRDRARVRRRETTSWLLRRKQRSAYNTLLKELHTEDQQIKYVPRCCQI